jgi:predicted transglutaminase-like cysteine proteinase
VRSISRVSAVAIILSVGTMNVYGAEPMLDHVRFDRPSLAPMAYAQFCPKYPRECRTARLFRGGPIKLSADRKAK